MDDDDPGDFVRRDRPLDTGFTMVPHGLWTMPVSTGARILLGWLQSHSDAFLAHLSLNAIRRAMSTSKIAGWLDELERAGMLQVHRPGPRRKLTIVLLTEPWLGLNRAQMGAPKRARASEQLSPDGPSDRAQVGSDSEPTWAYREEQGEDQGEDQPPPPTPSLTLVPTANGVSPGGGGGKEDADTTFELWWALYPKKTTGKGEARTKWRKMTKVERQDAYIGLERHVVWWRENATPVKFMPAGVVWLNQRRWEDEQPRTRERTDDVQAALDQSLAEAKARRTFIDTTATEDLDEEYP